MKFRLTVSEKQCSQEMFKDQPTGVTPYIVSIYLLSVGVKEHGPTKTGTEDIWLDHCANAQKDSKPLVWARPIFHPVPVHGLLHYSHFSLTF